MTTCSMKICSLLLLRVCMLFAAGSVTSSVPENSSYAMAVVTTNRQSASYVTVSQPAIPHPAKPTDVTAHAEEAVSPTADHKNGARNTTDISESRRLSLTTAEAATSGSKPLAPTEKVTTLQSMDAVPLKTTAATVQASTVGVTSTGQPQSVSQTITARREAQPFSEMTTASGEAKSSTVAITATSKERVSLSKTTGDAQTFAEVTSTGSGLQPSTAMTTPTSEIQPTHRTATAETVNQTTDHLLLTSPSSSTDMTAPLNDSTTSAASHASTQHPTSTTEFSSEVPSTTSLDKSAQSTSTSSAPTTSGTVKPTTAELSSSSHSVVNSTSPDPNDYSNTTNDNSTNPAGVFILNTIMSGTSSAPSTTNVPCKPSKDSNGSAVLSCSTKGVVKQCLVIIAVLAVVATIFVVSTIVLCVKLSARKYRVRKPQQDTEMMCISALLPDRSQPYTRHRNPVSNGVLVYPAAGDSDEEGGDNLTLSSFLPENDRYV